MKRWTWYAVVLAAALVVIVLTAKAQGAVKIPSVVGNAQAIKLTVTGKCQSAPDGGQLKLRGTGFTPNHYYTWKVWYPNGRLYTYSPPGTPVRAKASALGTVSMDILCGVGAGGKPDPAGAYRIQLTDVKSGLKGEIHYKIDAAPAAGTTS